MNETTPKSLSSRRSCKELARVQERLNAELERLSKLCGLGFELKVIWEPRSDTSLAGEVNDHIIHLYELEEEKALMTFRHEFLDYILSEAIEPYKEVTNMLIRTLNRDAYKRKEKIVGVLAKLLDRAVAAERSDNNEV